MFDFDVCLQTGLDVFLGLRDLRGRLLEQDQIISLLAETAL